MIVMQCLKARIVLAAVTTVFLFGGTCYAQFNVNDAFVNMETPNGSESITFAGPEGGHDQLGL